MENMASAYVWIGIAFFLLFLGLAYASAWLHGPRWFVATIATLAGCFLFISFEIVTTTSNAQRLTILAIFLWVFGGIFYLIALHHITHTKLLDLTYQSHEALVRFITEHQVVSPLATVMRALGPILLGGIVVLAGIGIWMKSN